MTRQSQYSRLEFLQMVTGAMVASGLMACTSTGVQKVDHTPIVFPKNQISDNTMNSKILVTYASRTGYTFGVAEHIKKTMEESGNQVDLCKMADVTDLTPYRAVVAGSAIQDRQWLPEAMEFVENNSHALSQLPFAAFQVCMTLAMPNGEKYREGVIEWMQPVRNRVKTVSEGFFAGGLDIDKIPSRGDRFKFRVSVMLGVWKEGDHRNWAAIKNWATVLNTKLNG